MFTFPVGFFNLIASGGGGGTTDPFAANVVLYLRGDGTNNSTTIVDSSPTPKTISVFGNAQISTAQSKYGGSSLFATNTTVGNFVQAATTINLSANYTFEAWIYQTAAQDCTLLAGSVNGDVDFAIIGSQIRIGRTNVAWDVIVNVTFTYNTFQHIAFSRSGGTQKIFLNGVEVFSGNYGMGLTATNPRVMCSRDNFANQFVRQLNGYIDSVRFTDSVTRYTANFNPETDTYLDISTNPTPTPNTINRCLATNGGIATASSTINSNYPASSTINGDRKGLNWENGGGWNSTSSLPASLEVAFSTAYSITKINVITLQDNYNSPVEPTTATTFSSFGVTSYSIEYWNGSAWIVIDSTTGNNKVYKEFTFSAVTTTKIRVYITASADGVYARLVEVEAY